jgi:hypothetical protein
MATFSSRVVEPPGTGSLGPVGRNAMREIENMEIPKVARAQNLEEQRARVRTKVEECGRGAESACARAMAEAERVLREISVAAPCTHFDLSLARAMPDCLTLDPGLDFVLHDDGMIELTETGFRRMGQAHSAGLGTAIEIDKRDVFRFPPRSSEERRRMGSAC